MIDPRSNDLFWGDKLRVNDIMLSADRFAPRLQDQALAVHPGHGLTEALPEGKRNTGRPNLGGPLTTASGLIFIGATDDSRFRAFDSKTGKELWVTTIDAGAHAAPMTFQGKNGKQYVVITATGGGFLGDKSRADTVIAYALP